MRTFLPLVAIAVVSCSQFAACGPTQVDGIAVYGSVSALSKSELRSAVAAAKSSMSRKVSSLDVVGRNEIHVYVKPRELGWSLLHRPYGDWVVDGKAVWQIPAAMQLIKNATKVYIFPIKTPWEPHRNKGQQRLLSMDARHELAYVLGQKSHWWQGLYTIACVGSKRSSIGFAFQGQGQTLVLFFENCGFVDGTMNGQNVSGLFAARTAFKAWKDKFAALELSTR